MKHIKKFNESEENPSMNLEEAAENHAIVKGDYTSEYYIAFESFKAGAEWYKNSIEHKHTSDDQSSSEFDHNLSNLKKGTTSTGSTYFYKDSEKDGYIDVAQRDRLGRVTGYMTVKSGTGIYIKN
jgi:hypothetical protein